MEHEAADTFAVHMLPMGRVAGYDDEDMAGEADLAADALRRMGGRRVDPVFQGTAVRSLTEADEALAHWAGEQGDEEPCSSALLWFGHGRAAALGSVLLVPDSEERNARVTPDMVAHHVHTEQQSRTYGEGHWALVVFEACNSENFAEDVAQRFNGTGQPRVRSLLLIATGKAAAQGYLGTFRRVLESFVNSKTSHDEVFTLRDLQRHFADSGCYARLVGDDTHAELRLLLPGHVPLAGATSVADQRREQSRFDQEPVDPPQRKVPDRAGFLEVVHDFTGRTRELQAVADWRDTPGAPALLVVTGPPGTGKSALLGEAVQRWLHRRTPGNEGADAKPSRAAHISSGAPGEEPTTWELPYVAAVLALTGSTSADVVRRLGVALGTATDGADAESSGDAAQAVEGLRLRLGELVAAAPASGTPTRALIVADALDEARDPLRVATLLRDLTAIPGVRLLIGTRPSPFPSLSGTGRADLLEVLGAGTGDAEILKLAPDPAATRARTERGVRRILQDHPAGDEAWQETVVDRIGQAVDSHVSDGSWQFLQAALVLQEIEQRPGVLSADPQARTALDHLLARDQTGLFHAAVARITAGLPTARPLLRALAYAHGRGLPLADGIWARAAAGIAGSGSRVDEEQLELFLNRAAAYVLIDGEDRRSVYRLAHHTHAEDLLTDSTPRDRQTMLAALLDLAADQAGDGGPLSPHLAARLAEYAADCGAAGWAALGRRPAVIDRLAPASLSTLALTPGPGTGTMPTELPVEVLGTVASAHLIKASLPGDRPALRQLGGLRAAGALHEAGPDSAWEVCWGKLLRVPLHLRLGGPDGVVTALAARPDATWLVTGSHDGTVVVWRPWRGHVPVLLLRGCDKPVRALAVLAHGPSGPGLLAVAHHNRTIQLWDTAAEHHRPLAVETDELVTVMAVLPDGTRRCVVAGEVGFLALLGPSGSLQRAETPLAATDVVGLAPVPGSVGPQLVVAANQCGLLSVWDVGGTVPVLVHRRRARTGLSGLTWVTDPVAGPRIVTVSDEGHVGYWRVEAGDRGPEIIADRFGSGPAAQCATPRVLATLPVSEESRVPVIGDERGRVRVVPPPIEEAAPAGVETSTGTGTITAIGALRGPHGGAVLVTAAERDPTVHFWDPQAVAPDGTAASVDIPSAVSELRRHVFPDGREALVVTERRAERTVERVLDAADGVELTDAASPADGTGARKTPLPEGAEDLHGRVMGCVDLVGLDTARGVRVRATAGRDGTVVLWREDLHWRPVRTLRLGAPCLRLASLGAGRLAVAMDDGIAVLKINPVAWATDGRGAEDTHA
ncbi:AAA family ATPase [Streptomyces collinus]|uniref:AAA family ATPase n=1 Tax=Streptomyces collinus TaxID=42684 RepID=UPI0036470552